MGQVPLAARLREGAQHVLDVLVRLLPAEKEEVRGGQPVFPGNLLALLGRDVVSKERRHSVVDHLDAPRRDVEIIGQVSLAVVGNGDDAIGAIERPANHQPRVEVGPAAREELRIEDVNDVVDRDDRPALPERGQHVVGCVKEVEAVPPETPGEPGQLRQRVAGGLLGDDLEMVRHRGQHLPIRFADVDPKPVPARFLPAADSLEEMADIGSDSEVSELARVDADERKGPHRASHTASCSTAAVWAAARVQEKVRARARPARRRRSASGRSSKARSIWRASPTASVASA